MIHRKRECEESHWGINYSINDNNTLFMVMVRLPFWWNRAREYILFDNNCCYRGRRIREFYIRMRIRKWWRFQNVETVMYWPFKFMSGWVESKNRVLLCTEEEFQDGWGEQYKDVFQKGFK